MYKRNKYVSKSVVHVYGETFKSVHKTKFKKNKLIFVDKLFQLV